MSERAKHWLPELREAAERRIHWINLKAAGNVQNQVEFGGQGRGRAVERAVRGALAKGHPLYQVGEWWCLCEVEVALGTELTLGVPPRDVQGTQLSCDEQNR